MKHTTHPLIWFNGSKTGPHNGIDDCASAVSSSSYELSDDGRVREEMVAPGKMFASIVTLLACSSRIPTVAGRCGAWYGCRLTFSSGAFNKRPGRTVWDRGALDKYGRDRDCPGRQGTGARIVADEKLGISKKVDFNRFTTTAKRLRSKGESAIGQRGRFSL
jgi:hypothetical protein